MVAEYKSFDVFLLLYVFVLTNIIDINDYMNEEIISLGIINLTRIYNKFSVK